MTEEKQNRQSRKKWSDRFLVNYQQILSKWVGCEPEEVLVSNFEDDYKNATDLVLPDGRRVAAKTRRPEVLVNYRNEIVLRHNPHGAYLSEWQKVQKGKAQLLLYSYCNEAETHLTHWRIIDLEVLTTADLYNWEGCERPKEMHIPTKDVHFVSFNGASIEGKYGKLLLAAG